jgi:two-component system invasion response regulator UvrY
MTDMQTIRVLLVDDHPVVRDGYRRLLASTEDIRVIAEAGTGEEACDAYCRSGPDVLILDLNLPEMSGLECIRRIRAKDPQARILVFSMHDSPTMVTRALESGAAGYVSKSSAASEMVDAVRNVANDRRYVSHSLVSDLVNQKTPASDPLNRLTKREFEIFLRLAQGEPVAEIARVLTISPKTVGVHQTNIMKKLSLRNAADLTRLAIRCEVINP